MAQEQGTPPATGGGSTSTGMQENMAAMLAYLFTVLTGIIFILIEKENQFVRFHAFQSIFLGIGMFVISLIPLLGLFINIFIGLPLVIFLMVKAYKGESYKLPLIGEMAEKQAGIQA